MILCVSCSNARHFHRQRRANGTLTGKIIKDCLGGDCECPCCKLIEERKAHLIIRPIVPPPPPSETNTPETDPVETDDLIEIMHKDDDQ